MPPSWEMCIRDSSKGTPVKFSDEPSSFTYYFDAYPLYKQKYEVEGEDETLKPEEQKK